MASTEGCGDAMPAEVKDADQNNVKADEAPEEHAMPNKNATQEKRGRGRGTKRKSDADMMAEAKAVFGELNTSEGRQLRKRAEPPKVEKKTPARKASTRKSATPNSKKAKLDTSEGEEKADEDEQKDTKDDEHEDKEEEEKSIAEAPLNNGTTADVVASEEGKKSEEAEKKDDVPAQNTQEAADKVQDSAE